MFEQNKNDLATKTEMDKTDMKADAMELDKWPTGKFSIPMASARCHGGFTEGAAKQERKIVRQGNTHLISDHFGTSSINMSYCTQELEPESDSDVRLWPSGSYCIARYGDDCPRHFDSGSLVWDDNDNYNGIVTHGLVPDGDYDSDVKIQYCCRSDGRPSDAIRLPTEKEFILYPFGNKCQKVMGMKSTNVWFFFDSEDGSRNDTCEGKHPASFGCKDDVNHKIFLCHYK